MQAGRTNGYIGLAFSYSDLPIGICDKKLKQKLTTLNFLDAKNRNTSNYVSSQRRTYSLTSLGSIFIIFCMDVSSFPNNFFSKSAL